MRNVIELEINPLADWSGVCDRPLIVAGPCSAETEAQVLRTAAELAHYQVDYLRAGVWKARTRPSSFDGVGDEALHWLKHAGDKHNLKTTTEVATARHVELALRHGIDAIWIGARTTANPFSVQELADALQGTDIPVMVKNPINPDLALWVGAIERVHKAGVRNLAAIHRGFSTIDETRFRNRPMWDLVIELRRMVPNIPILNDPSHVAGRRDLVYSVSQRAMDLGLDGLIVESHPDPENAWSDADQQVTPERLGEILTRLKVRRASSDNVQFNESLDELRKDIDRIDTEILEVLAMRMRVVEKIGENKRTNNVTTLQVNRWKALLEDRMEKARALGLDGEYIKAIYDVIHEESIRRQSVIMSDINGGDG